MIDILIVDHIYWLYTLHLDISIDINIDISPISITKRPIACVSGSQPSSLGPSELTCKCRVLNPRFLSSIFSTLSTTSSFGQSCQSVASVPVIVLLQGDQFPCHVTFLRFIDGLHHIF